MRLWQLLVLLGAAGCGGERGACAYEGDEGQQLCQPEDTERFCEDAKGDFHAGELCADLGYSAHCGDDPSSVWGLAEEDCGFAEN